MNCKFIKKDNNQCTRKSTEASEYCWQHKTKELNNELKENKLTLKEKVNPNLLMCFTNSCSISSSNNNNNSFKLRFDETYYDPKNQNHIKTRSTYIGNNLTKLETYYKNGNMMSEKNYGNGKLESEEWTFYENGNKRSEINHETGEKTEWYSDGNIRSGKSKKGETEFNRIEIILKNGDKSIIEESDDENESQGYQFDESEKDEESEQEEADNLDY